MPASRSAVQGLRKAEASAVLEYLGISFTPMWTADEMKQVIKEHLYPKGDTAAQRSMKGVASMKKADLLNKAESLGIHFTPNTTNAKLRLLIRQSILAKTTPEGADFMGFGKHGMKTYQQVKDSDPGYVKWCKETSDPNSSPELRRFVSWLNASGVEHKPLDDQEETTSDQVPPEGAPATASTAPATRARPAPGSRRLARRKAEDQEMIPAGDETGAPGDPLGQIMGALHELNGRLQAVESQRNQPEPPTPTPAPSGAAQPEEQPRTESEATSTAFEMLGPEVP